MYSLNSSECKKAHMAMQDTLHVLNGKWKLLILISLLPQKRRFKELTRLLGISAKILSRELQELEMNNLVKRTADENFPHKVEYELTSYSKSLSHLITEMVNWGEKHRQEVMKGPQNDLQD